MLRSLTLDEIAEVTGGAVVDGPDVAPGASGEETVDSVTTDTRTLTGPDNALFVALRGEKFDGHAFLRAAADAGACAFLTDRSLKPEEPHLPHIVVPDTLHALGDIARLVRDDFKHPVVGVTGSVGKTTTKEMIAEVLGVAFQVHKSAANHNNEIGVPQTIFGLTDTHTALVVEMGMRGLGEIRHLCEIAAPTIGVITNIGSSHIERLGSRENIAKAKAELLEQLPPDGIAIYPATDDFADLLAARFSGKRLTVGIDVPADIQATEVARHESGFRFSVTSPWGTQKFLLPSPGEFNVQNALLAIAVGGTLGIPLDTIARALLRWKAPAMRMEILKGKDGVTILSDAYNAAPDSMVGALKTLKDTPTGPGGHRIAILGEMKELGAYADEGHMLVGRAAAQLARPDMLVVVGTTDAGKIAAGAMVEGFSRDKIHYFDTSEEAAKLVPLIVGGADVVLVKGSRAMAMEKIVAALGGEVGAPPPPSPPPPPAPPPLRRRGESEDREVAPLAESGKDTSTPLLRSGGGAGGGGKIAAILDRERRAGFPSFLGAALSVHVPIKQSVLDDLLAFGIASAPPMDGVSDVRVRFAGNDLLAVQATIEKWLFRKTIHVEARVERYVPFAHNPVLKLTLLTRGVVELVLNVVPLPKCVAIDGPNVRVNLGDLLRENGLGELIAVIREVNVNVRQDVAHLSAQFAVAGSAA